MHRRIIRTFALAVVGTLALAGCAQDGDGGQAAQEASQEQGSDSQGGEGATSAGQQASGEMTDPNENVENGVFKGAGVVVPVPEGWQLEPTAFQQGTVLGMSEDQSQQLSARAIDAEEASGQGQDMSLDSLLEAVRQDIDQEPTVDEEVDLQGADRGHRLTYEDVPAQQEGAPDSTVTILLAESGDGTVGQFTYAAEPDGYQEQTAERLVEVAGFDPDSEPPEMPQAPAPQGGGSSGAGEGAGDGGSDGSGDGSGDGAEGGAGDGGSGQ